ncbi:MAG TPA: hypothetical protein VH478_15545 [Trebonia sp.]|jgi:hypothetical protein|nr:hypothetical protein [Trebonia sp.]
MRMQRADTGDDAAIADCLAVQEAAQAAEDRFGPPKSARVLRVFLAEGWEANPCEAWLAYPGASSGAAARGEALGWYWLELPDKENLDRAVLVIMARPGAAGDQARAGLLRHAAGRARAAGRTKISVFTRQGTPAAAFLRSAGAVFQYVEARRALDVRALDQGHVAGLREAAAKAAAGYTVVAWEGPTPEEHLAGVALVLNAMNDAPHEEGAEDAVWDADRARERADASLRKMGTRGYSVAAIHDATGAMAGLTQVEVDPDTPSWGHQGLTGVTREHRGHRLGMLVKATMLEWLPAAEPQVERIETGNADSNEWMIAINEDLGFQVLDPPWDWFELGVGTVLGDTVPGDAVPGESGEGASA